MKVGVSLIALFGALSHVELSNGLEFKQLVHDNIGSFINDHDLTVNELPSSTGELRDEIGIFDYLESDILPSDTLVRTIPSLTMDKENNIVFIDGSTNRLRRFDVDENVVNTINVVPYADARLFENSVCFRGTATNCNQFSCSAIDAVAVLDNTAVGGCSFDGKKHDSTGKVIESPQFYTGGRNTLSMKSVAFDSNNMAYIATGGLVYRLNETSGETKVIHEISLIWQDAEEKKHFLNTDIFKLILVKKDGETEVIQASTEDLFTSIQIEHDEDTKTDTMYVLSSVGTLVKKSLVTDDTDAVKIAGLVQFDNSDIAGVGIEGGFPSSFENYPAYNGVLATESPLYHPLKMVVQGKVIYILEVIKESFGGSEQERMIRSINTAFDNPTIEVVVGTGSDLLAPGVAGKDVKLTSVDDIAVNEIDGRIYFSSNGQVFFVDTKTNSADPALTGTVQLLAGTKSPSTGFPYPPVRFPLFDTLPNMQANIRGLIFDNSYSKMYIVDQREKIIQGTDYLHSTVRTIQLEPNDANIWVDVLALNNFADACNEDIELAEIYTQFVLLDSFDVVNDEESEEVRRLLYYVTQCSYFFVQENPGVSVAPFKKDYIQPMIRVATDLANSSFPMDIRLDAVKVEAFWKTQLRENAFYSQFPPPQPQIKFGDNQVYANSIKTFRAQFEPSALQQDCVEFFIYSLDCPCGSKRKRSGNEISRGSKCEGIEKDQLAEYYASLGYCANAEGIYNTSVSVRALQKVRECVLAETWKENSQRTNFQLLSLIEGSAVVSRNQLASEPQTASVRAFRNELSHFKSDVTVHLKNVSRSIAFMDKFGAVSLSHPNTVNKKAYDELEQQMELAAVVSEVSDGLQDLSDQIFESQSQLLSEIDQGFKNVNQNLIELGNLFSQNSIATAELTAKGLNDMAENFKASAEREMEVYEAEVDFAKTEFINAVTVIKEDEDKVKSVIQAMQDITKQLGTTTEKFYDCKEDRELAALARRRATAIFDVITGSIAMIAEGAAMIFTAGGSTALKAGIKTGAKAALNFGKKGVTNFLKKSKSSFKNVGKFLSKRKKTGKKETPAERNARRKEQAESVVDFMGVVQDNKDTILGGIDLGLDVLGGNVDFSTKDGRVDFAVNTLDALDSMGVPFAGNAATIVGAANVLANYEGQKAEIKSKYQNKLKSARAAFEVLAMRSNEISWFIGNCTLELGDMIVGVTQLDIATELEVPDESIAETVSTTMWVEMHKTLVSEVQSTEIYNDFQNGRRLLVEDPALEYVENNQLASRLRGRALLTSPNPVAHPNELRRSLDSKKPRCKDDEYNRLVVTGQTLFEQYLDLVYMATQVYAPKVHENMAKLVKATRRLVIAGMQVARLKADADMWGEYNLSAEPTKEQIENNRKVFAANILASERIVPKLTQPQSKIYSKVTELQQGVVGELCRLHFYQYLERLEQCDFTMSTVLNEVTDGNDGKKVLQTLRNIQNDRKNVRNSKVLAQPSWVRIPVTTAAKLKIQLQSPPNKAQIDLEDRETAKLTKETVFNFDLVDVPDALAGCGHNFEMGEFFLVMEEKDQLQEDLMRKWVPFLVKHKGPYIKTDKDGKKHLFDIQNIKQSDAARDIRLDSSTLCGESSEFEHDSFLVRKAAGDSLGKWYMCYEKRVENDMVPLLGTYEAVVGNHLEYIEKGNPDVELVMYAQVTLNGKTEACTATDFSTLEYIPSNPDITLPPQEQGGLGGGAIAGISIGSVAALAILGAVIFVVMKKKRNAGGATTQHYEDAKMATASL